MTGLRPHEDAYGRAMLDFHEGRRGWTPMIERDDGNVDADFGVDIYFDEKFAGPEREALRFARGRVLDVGAGAGRVALHLQNKGHDVVAIDNSPGAVKVMKERGVTDARVLPFKEIDERLGRFDTIVMWGNNFGLFGRAAGVRSMLRRLKKLTNPGARVIGMTVDIYDTDQPVHLAYHRFNHKRGRMAGELRMRVRYQTYKTPWFDYIMVSPEEMADLASGTGWFLERAVHFEDRSPPIYFGILEKED